MFLGEYQHSLDAKGRVILPSRFRARVAEGCVLTKGQDRCLYLFTLEAWEQIGQKLMELRMSKPKQRNFGRFLFSGAAEEVPDKQGRIRIPESLRNYASLTRDVAVLGVGNRIEVWDRDRWEQHRAEGEQSYTGLGEGEPDEMDLPF